MYEQLKKAVCLANIKLQLQKLVICNWGNVSGIDRAAGVIAIKPSGVPYNDLTPEKMVIINLDGTKIEGDLNPSSDTPTHMELYRHFQEIGGVVHTHSRWATIWAQTGKAIPALGTTHADYFYGAIPCTRKMTTAEIEGSYEAETGAVIVGTFAGKNPNFIPGVLVNNHGPFAWGKDAAEAVHNAVVLEEVAMMASQTVSLNPGITPIDQVLLDKHFLRKHGANAYYGQGN
jgi:L-ribulose-5-phosphate 4-epimerase